MELFAALLTGVLIGLTLGLIGGGGSIIAVPLLVYFVKVPQVHVAIGTAAAVVAINAAVGLAGHARKGNVKWRCGFVFAAAGILGAWFGAWQGQRFDGDALLALFGLLMIAIASSMLRPKRRASNPDVRLTQESAAHLLPRLLPAGLAVGALSGFFGIGGGFLIVPALMLATNMPIGNATATSLVVVASLGLTTAASYALSGSVDWSLTALVLLGGIAGATGGIAIASRLSSRHRQVEVGFAILVMAVGIAVAAKGLPALTALVGM